LGKVRDLGLCGGLELIGSVESARIAG
jgi:hypothetical protein